MAVNKNAKNISELNKDQKLNNEFNADRRVHTREPLYFGEFPEVKIKIAENEFLARVRDVSAGGISLCNAEFSNELKNQHIEIIFNQNSRYSVYGEIVSFKMAQFTDAFGTSEIPTIGIKFEKRKTTAVARPKRFACPKNFSPIAYANHPFKFNHLLHFTISDFAAQGMTLKTSSSNNLIFPGIKLDLKVMLPLIGEFEVNVEITNITSLSVKSYENHSTSLTTTSATSYYTIGCYFQHPSVYFLEAISSYLLLDGISDVTISNLKDNGFLTPKTEYSSNFTYVTNQSEWKEILDLRLNAAQYAGRWIGETDSNKLIDNFDPFARHLICKMDNKIVGSARVVFNNGNQERVEHQKYFIIPQYLWNGKFIEASRICTDPDYRGSRIFLNFLQHVVRICGQTGIRYILMNCEDSLVPVYKRLGGIEYGVRFNTPFMQNKALNVMVFDIHTCLFGKHVKPLIWYWSWRPLYDFFVKQKILNKAWNYNLLYLLYLLYLSIGKTFFYFFNAKRYETSMTARAIILDKIRDGNCEK